MQMLQRDLPGERQTAIWYNEAVENSEDGQWAMPGPWLRWEAVDRRQWRALNGTAVLQLSQNRD